jgi:hypothetical protein
MKLIIFILYVSLVIAFDISRHLKLISKTEKHDIILFFASTLCDIVFFLLAEKLSAAAV